MDPKHDGFDTLATLEHQLGPLPPVTPRVRTGSGGEHIHLAYPADPLRISGGAHKLGDGIDILSDGLLAIMPPSVTDKGAYRWLTDRGPTTPPAPIPSAWLERMRPTRARVSHRDGADDHAADPQHRRGDASLPLGQAALEFLECGVPVGQQRAHALIATRNLLARGISIEDTIGLVWQGLERSPQEPGRHPGYGSMPSRSSPI